MVWNVKWNNNSLQFFSNGLECPNGTITIVYSDNIGKNWFDETIIRETNQIYGSFTLKLTNIGKEDY